MADNITLSDVPEGWTRSTIGDVCEKAVNGGTPKRSEDKYWGGDIPWLSSGEVRGRETTSAEEYITEEALDETSAKLFPQDSVLVAMYGGGTRGRSTILRRELSGNQAICCLVPDTSICTPEYLWSYLSFIKDRLAALGQGGAQLNLNQSIIRNVEIPVPPLEEQRKIVSKIDEIFSRIDAGHGDLKDTKQRLEAYKSASESAALDGSLTKSWRESADSSGSEYLTQILDNRLDLWKDRYRIKKSHYKKTYTDEELVERYEVPDGPDREDLTEIPETWTWASLGQLAVIEGGLTKNQKERRGYPIEVPYLRVANVYSDELRLEDIKSMNVEEHELSKTSLEKDDLLIVEGNGSKSQIGRVAIWDGSISPCVHQNHLIKIRPVDKGLSRYLLRWLLSSRGRRFIEKVASSTSGLYTLSLSKVRRIPVPLPPAEETEHIIDELDRRISVVDQIMSELENEFVRVEKLRQSVLRELFKGKLYKETPSDIDERPDGDGSKDTTNNEAKTQLTLEDVSKLN